jgi:hypothetical protein
LNPSITRTTTLSEDTFSTWWRVPI